MRCGSTSAALEPPPTAMVANLPYSVATPLILRTIAELPALGALDGDGPARDRRAAAGPARLALLRLAQRARPARLRGADAARGRPGRVQAAAAGRVGGAVAAPPRRRRRPEAVRAADPRLRSPIAARRCRARSSWPRSGASRRRSGPGCRRRGRARARSATLPRGARRARAARRTRGREMLTPEQHLALAEAIGWRRARAAGAGEAEPLPLPGAGPRATGCTSSARCSSRSRSPTSSTVARGGGRRGVAADGLEEPDLTARALAALRRGGLAATRRSGSRSTSGSRSRRASAAAAPTPRRCCGSPADDVRRRAARADRRAPLGADVPSQLEPRFCARRRGGGGGRRRCPTPLPFWAVLLPDPEGLSTADVYAEADRLGLGARGGRARRACAESCSAPRPAGASPARLRGAARQRPGAGGAARCGPRSRTALDGAREARAPRSRSSPARGRRRSGCSAIATDAEAAASGLRAAAREAIVAEIGKGWLMQLPCDRRGWLKLLGDPRRRSFVAYMLVKRLLPDIDPQQLLEDVSESLGAWTYRARRRCSPSSRRARSSGWSRPARRSSCSPAPSRGRGRRRSC